MRVIRPGDRIDRHLARNSVFLAGPTPRDETGLAWRDKAIELFKQQDDRSVGTIFAPTPFIDSHSEYKYNYQEQIDWENRALMAATVIMFWVPRDLKTMPAFTTNVEFGMYIQSGKVIYGRPSDAPKVGYLDWHAKQNNVPTRNTLEGTVYSAWKEVALMKGVLQG
jgi:hypothetical protein